MAYVEYRHETKFPLIHFKRRFQEHIPIRLDDPNEAQSWSKLTAALQQKTCSHMITYVHCKLSRST